MGCDIHLYIEYRKKPAPNTIPEPGRRWNSLGGRINPGRNYALFAALAGVRGDGPEPKGYPEDAGFWADEDATVFISDTPSENYVTPATAERWVKEWGCKYRNGRDGAPKWVTCPDWHSHSWATIAELEAAVEIGETRDAALGERWREVEYRAVLAAMRSLAADGNEVRAVYWFDN